MKKLILLLLIIRSSSMFGEDTLKTYYGDRVYPVDTFRVLNFFINIIYDLCDTCDPCRNKTTPNWMPDTKNSVNEYLPVYLDDFMDSDLNPDSIHGTFTKRYAEASFNRFIVLGDHVVVNIKQSDINPLGYPDSVKGHFKWSRLVDSCISLINQYGGLQTINGHDNISDYDGSYTASFPNRRFKPKPQDSLDNKIDFMQVYIRNCTGDYGGLGHGGKASFINLKPLIIGGIACLKNAGTITGGVENTDLSAPEITYTDVHELAHNLLGMN